MRGGGGLTAGICCLAIAAGACSPKKMGIGRMADALSSTAATFSRDNDPEFVRLAAPSTLKMVEMLLDDQPSHAGLLMTACSGFTQYSYAFLQVDFELSEAPATPASQQLKSRAAAMYVRARDYCGRALELRHSGARQALAHDPQPLLASAAHADVPAMYWTAVAWGGELSLADNQLMRLAELAAVRGLLTRAVELDEGWEHGAIHEALIALDGLPRALGGSVERARMHFDRAVALSNGQSAFAYVTMAASVAQPGKDRAEFERLLRAALAIHDAPPSMRLANLIAQKRARVLLSRASRLF
jgi:TRAP transporter TatT component family protein